MGVGPVFNIEIEMPEKDVILFLKKIPGIVTPDSPISGEIKYTAKDGITYSFGFIYATEMSEYIGNGLINSLVISYSVDYWEDVATLLPKIIALQEIHAIVGGKFYCTARTL